MGGELERWWEVVKWRAGGERWGVMVDRSEIGRNGDK